MKKVKRLFEQFAPESYALKLNADKKSMRFSGEVSIAGFKKGRPSQRLTFHARGIKVIEAEILALNKEGGRDKVALERIVQHKAYDEVRLHVAKPLPNGKYNVRLKFTGEITRPMSGIYPCFYEDEGSQEILIATQFESHHAREVFPCIDEPEAKAVFSLSLASNSGETVIANTEPVKTEEKAGRVWTTFAPTPRMSTYLLAFVIGKIEYLEGKTKDGVIVRTYATPQLVKHTQFALDVGIKCLEIYNEYFAIDFPLPKCDLVALPDFAAGAMENWGLITFREQALIVDPDNTSLGMKQYVCNVIAHELTHQWFGNLVTMHWWSDLWLNESFATLMSYLAEDKLFPEWQMWKQFITDEQGPAQKLDSLENTHPIVVEINHPDEIRTIFDNISYEKGASVLFMLMHYLGDEPFRKGLQHYLKKHAYGNTESKDLWSAWEDVSKKPIAEFMAKWTGQAGYPLVSVNEGSAGKLYIKQERFYLNPKAKKEESVWPVPLFALPDTDPSSLNRAAADIVASKHTILNHQRRAFDRVIYSEDLILKLKDKIVKLEIDELDRQGILSDSFEAAKAGYQSVIPSLKLLDAYINEDSVLVWEIIAGNIGAIKGVMDNDEIRDALNKYLQKFIKVQYEKLGWVEQKNDSHFTKLLRPIILALATTSELPDALNEAKKRFASKDKNPIDPDIRGVVYSTVARHGGKAQFEKLLRMHDASINSEERVTLTAALTNFKQPDIIERALGLITTETVRLQDSSYWISYSFGNRYAKDLTWQWLKANWEWLEKNLSGDLSFYMMPRYAARAFSDVNIIPEFEAFFKQNLSEAFKRPLSQAIETITWQSAWRERDLKPLKEYLENWA